jgi:hypothetical protein
MDTTKTATRRSRSPRAPEAAATIEPSSNGTVGMDTTKTATRRSRNSRSPEAAATIEPSSNGTVGMTERPGTRCRLRTIAAWTALIAALALSTPEQRATFGARLVAHADLILAWAVGAGSGARQRRSHAAGGGAW